MKLFFRHFFCFFLLSAIYLLLTTSIQAQDYRSDYQVEYFLNEVENRLNTQVKISVTITNYRSDVYVKQFSIGFPKFFTLKDIKASDDNGYIKPEITSIDQLTRISLEFSNPNIGKNSVGNFFLEFNQNNLFNVNGNVWEVIIPTVDSRQKGDYKILVHLPPKTDKKISISKPPPDSISGNTITWNNPTTKTVYVVFGDIQYYKTDLTYNLKNSKLVPVFTDIAFPPDTLYQKIYVDSINPIPVTVFSDEDGNFLARYHLNPKETKTVVYSGMVAVSSKVRDEIVPIVRQSFLSQKKYLLDKNKYWQLSKKNSELVKSSNVNDIYNFVVETLTYDYKKINSDNNRLGADAVLAARKNAVCMEFTDLFIALARQKDIYAREIEGYGFSQDPNLRPLSLVSDILHSWPEYFDSHSQLWIPLDPTWENTSGIDYFSSFDLNHITFAIHGKDPEYPLPAGTYKIQDSRDVSISASNKKPVEKQSIVIEHSPLPGKINDNRNYQIKLSLTNTGNTYLWSKALPIKTSNIEISPAVIELKSLAPYEKKELVLTLRAKDKNKKTPGGFIIKFPQGKILKADFSIIPFYYELALLIALVLAFLAGTVFLITLFKKAKRL